MPQTAEDLIQSVIQPELASTEGSKYCGKHPSWSLSPKKDTLSNDYRPVALTSHITKTLERLVLAYIRPRMSDHMDPLLQFANQPNITMDDALVYMPQRIHAHLESVDASVRIMVFDFSNTVQPVVVW